STIATMIQALATTAMIHQVLSRSTPAITATAMMNPASIRNREPTTGTRESYGCCSSCDSPEGAVPSDCASCLPEVSGAACSGFFSSSLGVAGGERGGGGIGGEGGGAGVVVTGGVIGCGR